MPYISFSVHGHLAATMEVLPAADNPRHLSSQTQDLLLEETENPLLMSKRVGGCHIYLPFAGHMM